MMKALTIASTLLMSGAAMAQTYGPTSPGAADTTDPNSAPLASPRGAPPVPAPRPGETTGYGAPLDPAGRANTSDPNSAYSGATGATGRPANPMADPRVR